MTLKEKLYWREVLISYYYSTCRELGVIDDKYYPINIVLDKSVCFVNKRDIKNDRGYLGLCDHGNRLVTVCLGDNNLEDVCHTIRHEARHVWQRYNWSRTLRYADSDFRDYEHQLCEIDACEYAAAVGIEINYSSFKG